MLAAVLGPAEVVTRRLYLAAASLGALAGAAAAAAGTQLWLQASVFAAVAAGGVATRQLLLKPYLRAVAREGRMAGTATVVDEVSDNAGWARYCGSRWAARTVGAVIQPGTKVVIAGLAADGSTLWVYPADAAPAGRASTAGGSRPASLLARGVGRTRETDRRIPADGRGTAASAPAVPLAVVVHRPAVEPGHYRLHRRVLRRAACGWCARVRASVARGPGRRHPRRVHC